MNLHLSLESQITGSGAGCQEQEQERQEQLEGVLLPAPAARHGGGLLLHRPSPPLFPLLAQPSLEGANPLYGLHMLLLNPLTRPVDSRLSLALSLAETVLLPSFRHFKNHFHVVSGA